MAVPWLEEMGVMGGCRGMRACRRSAGELLHQLAHGEVDAQRADLVTAQVVDDRVGDADLPAGGRDPSELAGMRAGEVGLDRGLALVGEQVLEFHPRVERVPVDVPGQLGGGLPPVSALVAAFEAGHNVVGEVSGEVGPLDQGVEIVLHDLTFGAHGRSPLFFSRSQREGWCPSGCRYGGGPGWCAWLAGLAVMVPVTPVK